MKALYKCEYCDYINIEEKVKEHEHECSNNPTVIQKEKRLRHIKLNCKYCQKKYDGYDEFYACIQNGDHGRHTKSCTPREECAQYIK